MKVRQDIIQELTMKYGRSFLKQRTDYLTIRRVSEKNGRLVVIIPYSLLPTMMGEVFYDPFDGVALPELVGQVFPSKKHLTNVGFCKEFSVNNDATTKQEVAELTFCAPEEAKYLLFMVRQAAANSEQEHDTSYADWISKPSLLWSSSKYVTTDAQRYYTDYWLLEKSYLQKSGYLLPSILTNDTETKLRSDNYLVETNGDGLVVTSNRYADEFCGQGCWVIDPDGRLLKPDTVDSQTSRFIADVAEVEIWNRVSKDCLVLHWIRKSFGGMHICTVLNKPDEVTLPQIERANFIAAKITSDWSKRADPMSGQHLKDVCQWKLFDEEDRTRAAIEVPEIGHEVEMTCQSRPKPYVDPGCPW